ncbi:hypothetical protein GCM10022262_10650 [Georgenia daeguensis]|uniref:Uncharacterized protein n=1 Tax=Georgenia daeguensis TaxID=908355 RepID=A0ABP8ES07_9MICO
MVVGDDQFSSLRDRPSAEDADGPLADRARRCGWRTMPAGAVGGPLRRTSCLAGPSETADVVVRDDQFSSLRDSAEDADGPPADRARRCGLG